MFSVSRHAGAMKMSAFKSATTSVALEQRQNRAWGQTASLSWMLAIVAVDNLLCLRLLMKEWMIN